MEKSTWIGFIGGIVAVGVGMALKGADPHALINPAAFLIILPVRQRQFSMLFR